MLATAVIAILLILAACAVVGNWACVLASYRLRRKRSTRRVSPVPLVVQILVSLAALTQNLMAPSAFPGWLFWLLALADPVLVLVLCLPVYSFLRKYRARL